MTIRTKTLMMILSLGMSGSAIQASGIDPKGGISTEDLKTISAAYADTPADRAIHNAISNNSIDKLAINTRNRRSTPDMHFTYRVPQKGITNQKSSGRCWLFTGLNVLRAQMMAQHNLPELILSQNYNFFYDQLEKSNLFLQSIIDNANEPLDSRKNEWLIQHPLSDGGTYTGVANIITKYGVVPSEVMPETASSNGTATMRRLISLKLKEDALELRKMIADGASKDAVEQRKIAMLGEVYRMLALNLGEPPTEFEWTRRDAKGNAIDTRTYTPQEFYRTFAGNDLEGGYVMLMNDPSRPYYEMYEIDMDRHTYDGQNWTYINLPIEEIKEMAIASLKDSTAMYFSCDVGKFLDRELGLLDPEAFDYDSLLGTTFGMDKAQRIQTGASASSHAMTLVGVNIDKNGQPDKWLVENSWGNGANGGHLIMTDPWFNEYMFRLVVDRKYLTDKAKKTLSKKPVLLPAWDPMFSAED